MAPSRFFSAAPQSWFNPMALKALGLKMSGLVRANGLLLLNQNVVQMP